MIFVNGKVVDFVKYGKFLKCIEDDGYGVGKDSWINFVYLG